MKFSASVVRGFVILAVAMAAVTAQAAPGDLYYSESNKGTITVVKPSGAAALFVSGLHPFALAFDGKGNLFVADQQFGQGAPRILKITPGHAITTFATLSTSLLIGDLAFDANGTLYMVANTTSTGASTIYRFSAAGVPTAVVSGLGNTGGLALDAAGNIFIAEFTFQSGHIVAGAGKVTKIGRTGVRTTVTSGLDLPSGLVVDGAGEVWVVDQNNGRLYFMNAAGTRVLLATVAGSPNDLVRDYLGTLYLTTSSGIVKVAGQTVTTLHAGTSPAFLAIEPATAPAVNISTRARVETGQNVLVGGFIVRGTAPKPVLIRALGPTLTTFNVPGALADPVLQLFAGNTLIATNDDWAQAANASQIPPASRPPDSRESALLTTLNPGAYTAIVSGKNGTTGIGLVEVYDQNTATLSDLGNVSTRGFVGTGDAVMIGGFINSGGNGATQFLIRALGPTLTQFGVTSVLANPRLVLANANGATIATNDNWGTTQAGVIQATGYAPPNALEPAILIQLPAGHYSAIVNGSDGGSGTALVEIYNLRRP